MIDPKAQANYILSLSALSLLSGFYGFSQGMANNVLYSGRI